jgi:hypothetical protein
MTDRTRTIRNGLICMLIFAACFAVSWPVAQMGFDDDWSYIRTAQAYAQTGHFVYNGWSSPILGWQIPWGALFIRLFGFSFMAVKLSTVPIALATVFLFYVIQNRFGISGRNAIIGTLALGLSPLFLPLTASFMTDVPSLFIILLCLYFCQRAMGARSDASTILWLCIAAASNVAGGTVRQIAWLGALVMVPSTAWFLRKRRGVILAACFLWAGAVAADLYSMRWFAKQPYSVTDPLLEGILKPTGYPALVALLFLLAAIPCLLLLIFPVMIAWLPRLRSARGATLLAGTSAILLWVMVQLAAGSTLPWIPNLLVTEFSVAEGIQLGADRGPFLFPTWGCLLFSVAIAAAFLALLGTVRTQFRSAGGFRKSLARSPMFWLLAPYFFSYCGLLFLVASQKGGIFDRYLLGLMPVAIIILIRLHELHIAPQLPSTSAIAVAAYALLAIAGTHDWFAWQRARLEGIAELRAEGSPRTRILGGFEYDAWTQLEIAGYVENDDSLNPQGAYHPDDHLPRVSKACRLNFLNWLPAIRPTYTVAFAQPMPCLVPSKYPPIHYQAWLPPFQRTVYVQQFPAPRLSASPDTGKADSQAGSEARQGRTAHGLL